MHVFVYVCVCVCVCVCVHTRLFVCVLRTATAQKKARGPLSVTRALWSVLALRRPLVLCNNGKGNGLPEASSFSLIALPALDQPRYKTISSIYQPYARYVSRRRD